MPVQTMHKSRTRSMHSLRSGRQMPIIEERDDAEPEADVASMAPTLPEKSPRRAELAGLRDPLPMAFYPPPAYRVDTPPSTTATEEPSSPKKIAVRKPGWVARRGGWWRLGLIVLAVLSCILALALGLALGLRGKGSGNSSSSSTGNNSTQALQFPAGSYAFTTALANISTSCTNNTNTFRCYPYTTYGASGSGASATFYWSIAQVASSSTGTNEYVISAAPNPFVPQFQNISMAVLDRDTADERLEFSFPLNLALVPAAALDTANTAATCYFNDTVMGATIWTRRAAEFPANVTATAAASGSGVNSTNPSTDFGAWPFAVQVRQSAASGQGVPTCVDASGRSLGDFEKEGGGSCGCVYSNFGLSS